MMHAPTLGQFEAAHEAYESSGTWKASVEGLEALHRAVPGMDEASVLVKVAAVNGLYATNLYALGAMSRRIVKVLVTRPALTQDVAALVTEIAALPDKNGSVRRRHVSFASKFCHFFVDKDRFPIFDRFAMRAVAHHVGKRLYGYPEFVVAVAALRDAAEPRRSLRELDAYLWIAGQLLSAAAEDKLPSFLRPHEVRRRLGCPKSGCMGL